MPPPFPPPPVSFLSLQAVNKYIEAGKSKIIARLENENLIKQNAAAAEKRDDVPQRAKVLHRMHRRARAVVIRFRTRRKLYVLAVLLVLAVALNLSLPGHPAAERFYHNFIYSPWQSARNFAFGHFYLSFGDVLYILSGIAIVLGFFRWIYFIARWRTHRIYLWQSMLNTVVILASIYLLFFIGWGGNYYKPKLKDFWQLNTQNFTDNQLAVYNKMLIAKLDTLAPSWRPIKFRQVNKRSKLYYKLHTDSKLARNSVSAKPSVFGYFMQYAGIQGYYNPFTGEAQVNHYLPSFMLPFIVCHEMAHQCGIAAEGDANILSVAVCLSSGDKAFQYSGYFNLWLYTQGQLRHIDSTLAKQMLENLNPISRAQVDTLRTIRARFRGDFSEVTGRLYDSYLRMHNQEDGIESYDRVSELAWAWERQYGWKGVIRLPK